MNNKEKVIELGIKERELLKKFYRENNIEKKKELEDELLTLSNEIRSIITDLLYE